MEPTPLLHRDQIVTSLRGSLNDSEAGLSAVPGLLKRVLMEDCWRERVIKRTGQVVTFESFDDFVTTPPLEGLGATPDLIERIVRDDPEALTLLAEARAGKHGGDHRIHNTDSKIDNIKLDSQPDWKGYNSTTQGGTSAPYLLRRLKKQAPELHQRVLNKELSAHAAAIEAGWREKSITVPLNPERAAAALRRHFDAVELAQLIGYLQE